MSKKTKCKRCGFVSCACLGGPRNATDTKSARRARGLVRVEVWLDPVIAGALDALAAKRIETRSQTLRAAVLLLFQMQSVNPGVVKIQTSSTYGKTAAEVIGDAMARGVSSGMAAALGSNGRASAKIQPKAKLLRERTTHGTPATCKRCGKPCQAWQVFCGARCSAESEAGT